MEIEQRAKELESIFFDKTQPKDMDSYFERTAKYVEVELIKARMNQMNIEHDKIVMDEMGQYLNGFDNRYNDLQQQLTALEGKG